MKIKAILIDDEPLAISLLERQLSNINNIEVVETYNEFNLDTDRDILEYVNVVFLDIEMPGINGLYLAEQIIAINSHLPIVFVTAFNEYAVQAFELNALDYLLKPIKQERLEKTIQRIENNIANQETDVLPRTETLHIQLTRELRFSTSKSEQTITGLRWRTQKTRELFIYLLYHAKETILKSKLAELFWPNYEQERAFAQLYTAIYNIRKTLAPFNHHLKIESVYEGYTLFYKNVTVDIVEWENTVRKLPALQKDTIDIYEEAMSLYTGPFLEVYKYSWADPEQFRLGLLWIDIATQIADFYKSENAVEKAVHWYERICEYRPEDDHANLSIMKLHASLGYGILVAHQYIQYKKTLAELGLSPDPSVKEWYRNFKKQ